jgi:mannose-6-phosphate isomerase-like protein (cupin superfamily)
MSTPGYTPSPRPTFEGPAYIPYAAATRHLWGDAESGEVADWIYVSSDRIHQLVFGLPPGGAFRHSDAYRTIFGADELLTVLSGEMVISNPETGEVYRVRTGQSVAFGRDTWHHAFSYGSVPLRVLELFAPPPSQGTSGAYARTKPYLHDARYTQDQWLGRWPLAREEARRAATIHVLRDDDVLWRLEGRERPMLVGLLLATEQLTAGMIRLLPGQHSEVQTHGGDESVYLVSGCLNIRLPEHAGQRWFELQPGDGFYIPQGHPHQYYNMMDQPVEALFGVAPRYQPA